MIVIQNKKICNDSYLFFKWHMLLKNTTGHPAKKYIQLKLTKYLETLLNYNINNNYPQFLISFINRTGVLVVIVIFTARWRNNDKGYDKGMFIFCS